MSTAALKFADVCPDLEGAALLGETVDNFRQLARKPGFPRASKVGNMLFRKRSELLAYKAKRDATRKVKR